MSVVVVSPVPLVSILFDIKGHRNIFFQNLKKSKDIFLATLPLQKLKEIVRCSLRHWKDQSFYYENVTYEK